jgi:hypothetical protein
MKTENEITYYRPKFVGQLLVALKKNIKCEVVGTYEEITSIKLKGWLNFDNFKTYPSTNEGWVIYESI